MAPYNPDASPFQFTKTDVVSLFNTMPKITEKEFLKRANIPGVNKMPSGLPATDSQLFRVSEDYGYGAGKTIFTLEPGETRENIPAVAARELLPLMAHKGVVMLEPGESKLEARTRGMTEALSFLNSRGTAKYHEKTASMNEEEKKNLRLTFKSDLLIMEREKIVQEALDSLGNSEEVEEVVPVEGKKTKKSVG